MEHLSFLKVLEKMTLAEQIAKVADLLEESGCTIVQRSRRGITNLFYYKEGGDYVYGLIYKEKGNILYYTLMDYSTYKDIIEPDESIILNWIKRTMRDYKIVLRNHEYVNVPLHRLAIDCEGRQVDHKTHNACINIKDYLAACSNKENSINKKFYCKVDKKSKSFSAPASIVDSVSRISLCNNGFKPNGGRLCSPEYGTKAELYAALDAFEAKYLGSFRYNPLVDFSNTWYALVIQKMLGGISDTDLYEYNRVYMINNHAKIAEYYQLA